MKNSLTTSCAALLMVLLPVAANADSEVPDLPTINQSLTLRDALAVASANNLSLREAGIDTKIAASAEKSAKAQTLPSVAATTYGLVGDSQNIVSSSPGVMPLNYLSIAPRGFADQNLMLMAPIFTGGKLTGQAKAARMEGASEKLMLSAAQLTMQETVTDSYTQVLLETALVTVADARLKAEDEQLRITGERVATGRSAPLDLLREQAEEADAEQGQLSAQTEKGVALIRLRTVLGISQASAITLNDTLDTISLNTALPSSLSGAIQLGETDRPDLAAAIEQVDAARANVNVARSEYSPQIYGVGMADASALSAGGGRAGYTVGLTASMPIYDGGQRQADSDAAKDRLDRAIIDAQNVRQTVDQDIASAWLNLQAATQQSQTAQRGVDAAKQAYDLADLRYNAGKSLAADRLDALAALTRAQGDLETAAAQVIQTNVRLLTSIGLAL